MIKKAFILIVMFISMSVSCNRTTTPKEFLNKTEVSLDTYKNDKKVLKELTSRDSVKKTWFNGDADDYFTSFVDTIFYGPSNKIAFLVIFKRKNIYSGITNQENNDSIDFKGIGAIVYKEDGNFKSLKRLTYSSTDTNPHKTRAILRDIYFRQVHRIENEYNINDSRFWDSSVW